MRLPMMTFLISHYNLVDMHCQRSFWCHDVTYVYDYHHHCCLYLTTVAFPTKITITITLPPPPSPTTIAIAPLLLLRLRLRVRVRLLTFDRYGHDCGDPYDNLWHQN